MDNRDFKPTDCRFSLTMEDGRNVQINGCERVLVYEDDCVLIRLKNCKLRISGKSLTLRGYFGTEIVIGGFIYTLNLEAI
ncbi:MAG: YabP/YqfC family sporulation protein [Eubacteriales bacterium]